ncbi:MAG: nucleoside triphosphate hydrolase [Rhizobiaceae bacterium]
MIEKIDDIAPVLVDRASKASRFIVAIAGPPGAGKSTLAEQLHDALAKLGEQAAVIPMDGYHLDNAILEGRGLLPRKGAPQSFDAGGFISLIERLADPGRYGDVVIPVFDRSRDIAIAGAEIVSANTRILLCEGNYLLLDQQPWAALQDHWDYAIFINPGLDVIEQRLIDRWLDHGLNAEQAKARALGNDIPNARHVLEYSGEADLQVQD